MAARDTQRSRLYAWEISNLEDSPLFLQQTDRTPLALDEARALVNRIWASRNASPLGPPWLRILGNRYRGSYLHREHEIRLSSRHLASCHAWYVVHEATHALVFRTAEGRKWADHGPEFCALYASLLGEFTSGDEDEIRTSMLAAGLKVGTRKKNG